jgi:SNF2 family DNA or RNA helicase
MALTFDPSRSTRLPKSFQVPGVHWLLEHRAGMLYDDPGMGKSKQVVDYACLLHDAGEIRTVFVVCPALAIGEWDNLEVGHIAENAWADQQHYVHTFSAQNARFEFDQQGLLWVVASYDSLKNSASFAAAVSQLRRRGPYVLILDESSQFANRTTGRTKTIKKFRSFAPYCFGMSGTPMPNGRASELWSQFDVVCPEALKGRRFWQFKDEHAKFGGWKGKVETGIRNEEKLWDELRPWILMRLAKDHLNLDEPIRKITPVAMSDEAWDLYVQMREDMVAFLDDSSRSSAVSAGVKAVRMSQLTSGFLGGVKGDCVNCGMPEDDHVESNCQNFLPEQLAPRVIDDAKLKSVVAWIADKECGVIWSRFRFEIERTAAELRHRGYKVEMLMGGMGKKRDQIKVAFQTGKIDWIVANPLAAGMSMNLQRGYNMAFMSNVYSWFWREQTERRMIRLGQTRAVLVNDFVAVSPHGGKPTIDLGVLKKIKNKENISDRSKAAWKTIVL